MLLPACCDSEVLIIYRGRRKRGGVGRNAAAELERRGVVEELAVQFALTPEERNELLPSGTASLFSNRVGWARTYLKQAGLIQPIRRGTFQITDRGRAVLRENPNGIDPQFLERFEDFRAFRERRREASTVQESEPDATAVTAESDDEQTPEDRLASAYQRLREETAA